MICTIKMHLNYGLNILIIKTKLVLSSSNFNRFIKINTLWLFCLSFTSGWFIRNWSLKDVFRTSIQVTSHFRSYMRLYRPNSFLQFGQLWMTSFRESIHKAIKQKGHNLKREKGIFLIMTEALFDKSYIYLLEVVTIS